MKKNISKNLRSSIFFIFLFLLTYYFVFRDNNIDDIYNALKIVDIKYIVIGIICMLLYLFLDGINTRRVLNSLNNKVTVAQSFKYSLIGFFYSSITPSSTGGQPMQMYAMSKDKIKLSNSTITCLVNLACFQFVSISLVIVSVILGFKYTTIPGIRIMLPIGFLLNGIVLFFSMAAIFSKKMIVNIVKFITKFLKKIHYKKADIFYDKLMEQVNDFRDCAVYLKKHKNVLFKNIFTTIIQLLLFHSIPFFVYRSFGLNDYSLITFLLVQTILYISVSSLPFPGAVGVSEVSFMLLYQLLFPKHILSSAMLLSRGINFYLFVLVSGIFILIEYIYEKIKDN